MTDEIFKIRVLRLLEIINGTNKTIERMTEPHTDGIVKQYYYQKSKFVKELEDLLAPYEIQIKYDKIF